jgi:hypothetical protein
MKTLSLLLLIFATTSCAHPINPISVAAKIKFNTDDINNQGLRGTPSSLRAVAYEFCIPSDQTTHEKLQAIDPSVAFYPRSRGRINCSDAETLVIGNTHQAQWKSVLFELSSQDYIAAIRETVFE